MKTERRGFTMIELLVVISIMLVVSYLAYSIFTGRNSDKTRSAARIAQSAFLGAKDRALHARDLRGVRMIRDTTDSTLVTAFIYLQPLPVQATGNLATSPQNNFALARPNYVATGNTDATQVIISGAQAAAWFQQDSAGIWPSNRAQIRIPSGSSSLGAGPWYNLQPQSTTAPYWGMMTAGNLILNLQTPFQGGKPATAGPSHNAIDPTDSTASCDIQLGNDLLPFHQPISFPSSVIIDLKFCSGNVQSLAGVGSGNNPYIDLMFSPRGMLTGPIAAQGPLHFLLRDLQDAADTTVSPFAVGAAGSANPDRNKGDRMILTVFPQTGLVNTFDMDVTDNVDNSTGSAPPDGLADNPFRFAQLGKAAGR